MWRRRKAVIDADQAAEKARADLRATSAVLAAATEDHRVATERLVAAIEEQRKGWADVGNGEV